MSEGIVITKHGEAPSERVLEGKCSRCACEVKGKQRFWKEGHGMVDSWWTIVCPTPDCGGTIYGHRITSRGNYFDR